MNNYKTLKSLSKASVAKAKVIDVAKVDEVKYKDGDDIPDGKEVGDVKVKAVAEKSHEELQVTVKSYNQDTGAELDNIVRTYELPAIKTIIENCKKRVERTQSEQADWEELEKDLKAL
tara:strand:+ start:2008 stop:2361 length:354 start_codon:yes stop_codon:yes gene_type:complete